MIDSLDPRCVDADSGLSAHLAVEQGAIDTISSGDGDAESVVTAGKGTERPGCNG